MKDSDFKKLQHIAEGFVMFSDGSEISDGYKPDYVLSNGNEFIIMECETGTSRKGYVGGMIKAAKYLCNEKSGILIYVIKEKDNTKVEQIYNHLSEYYKWVKTLTNLKAVYIISTLNYYSENKLCRIFDSKFNDLSKKIEIID